MEADQQSRAAFLCSQFKQLCGQDDFAKLLTLKMSFQKDIYNFFLTYIIRDLVGVSKRHLGLSMT
jgi:hypothetical protein